MLIDPPVVRNLTKLPFLSEIAEIGIAPMMGIEPNFEGCVSCPGASFLSFYASFSGFQATLQRKVSIIRFPCSAQIVTIVTLELPPLSSATGERLAAFQPCFPARFQAAWTRLFPFFPSDDRL